MPQPYNYTANIPSPLQSFNSGLQSGAAVQELQTAQQQKQQALEQAKQLRIDLAEYQKNPSSKGIAMLSMKYPQLSEQFKRSYDMLAPEEQQARITSTVPIYAAIQNNKPEVAIELLEKASEASKNSGNEPQAAQQKAFAEMIKANPKQASTMVGLLLASTMGPDKFSSTFAQLEGEARANAEQPNKLKEGAAKADTAVSESVIKAAEAGNVGTAIEQKNADQIAQTAERLANIKNLSDTLGFNKAKFSEELKLNAKRLGYDIDKFTSELQLKVEEMRLKAGEIPEYVAKEINTASVESITAQESGKVLLNLANEFDAKAQEFDTGLLGKGTEAWKKVFGSANELTRIRANYKQLVTQQAMAAYKKVAAGSTSDKDIDTAMTGYPTETDSVEIISAKLRGMAKLAQYDSVLSNAKSEWLAANKNLAKAKQDLEIDDVGVPAGTTFKNFSDAYVTRKAEELGVAQNADANLKAIQNRPYMKYVKPEGKW